MKLKLLSDIVHRGYLFGVDYRNWKMINMAPLWLVTRQVVNMTAPSGDGNVMEVTFQLQMFDLKSLYSVVPHSKGAFKRIQQAVRLTRDMLHVIHVSAVSGDSVLQRKLIMAGCVTGQLRFKTKLIWVDTWAHSC